MEVKHAIAIEAKVKLEGIEVNFNSIKISETKEQPPVASISFPANEKILSLLPKTVAEIYLKIGNDFYLIFEGELNGSAISRTTDSRSVQLSFAGITNNWITNKMIPYEASLINIAERAFYGIASPTPAQVQGSVIRLVNSPVHSPLGEFAEKITEFGKGEQLKNRLEATIRGLENIFGDYYRRISRALKISNKTIAIDSQEVQKMLRDFYTLQYISGQIRGIGGSQAILSVLSEMLYYFTYSIQELAAPTQVGSDIKKILLAPISGNFSPISCNIIFNEQLGTFNYSRDYDNEPTRIVATTSPAELGKPQEKPFTLLLSIVIPHEATVASLFKNKKAGEGGRVFQITREERMRGINFRGYNDETNLLSAFIFSKRRGGEPPDKQEEDTVHPARKAWLEFNKLVLDQGEVALEEISKNVSNITPSDPLYYRARRTEFEFHASRYENRTASLTVDFNPYRLIGLPCLIIDENLPAIIGLTQQINTTIDAGGTISQNIGLSHVRTIPLSSFEQDDQYADDLYLDSVPWFSDEFGFNNIGKNYYSLITGNEKSDLKSWVPAKYLGDPILTQFREAIKNLVTLYNTSENPSKFVNSITKRNLVSESTYASVMNLEAKSLDDTWETISNPGDNLYLLERQNRVKEIFGEFI